jgi:hypothetical protein
MGVRDGGDDASRIQKQYGDGGTMVSLQHHHRPYKAFPSGCTSLQSIAEVWL